jgi:hypothetical protein
MKWTPAGVAYAREYTAESIINRSCRGRQCAESGYTSQDWWREVQTAQRLEWLYGTERAAAIMSGEDPETQADLAAWGGRVPNTALPSAA